MDILPRRLASLMDVDCMMDRTKADGTGGCYEFRSALTFRLELKIAAVLCAAKTPLEWRGLRKLLALARIA
jgi:hypothetical protein